jgi:futalosine hydrolase
VRTLIVAATRPEIAPLCARLPPDPAGSGVGLDRYTLAGRSIELLVTGVGMVATAARLSARLATDRYTLVLNLGVCGSFDPTLPPGTVVHVVRDTLPELGAEDGEAFLPAADLGLLDPDAFPFRGGALVNVTPPDHPVLAALPRVDGITVNTVHGHEPSIARTRARCARMPQAGGSAFADAPALGQDAGQADDRGPATRWTAPAGPQVESMEGAAFMYACLLHGVPFAQVRGVSNRVERRNRAAWRLDEAIARLNDVAADLLEPACD